MYSKELFKGTLTTMILKLLTEQSRMYGYEITQVIKQRTDGAISIKEGSLYPALHKLEKEGVIKAEYEHIGKRVRKYYSLTKKGKGVIKIKLEEFSNFIGIINKILNPQASLL